MISLKMLTGLSIEHLDNFGQHRLQPEAKQAFLAMQHRAAKAGFDLQPASTFRDFDRQQTIWNEKFNGLRPVLDHNSLAIDVAGLSDELRCRAILHWSALPGASRHHWGTDLDIYDPSLLPNGQSLKLEPWEYEASGYFYALSCWLTENMANYGFFRPFENRRSAVADEPWHISYRPTAQYLAPKLTPEALLYAWQNREIGGYRWLTSNLDDIFSRYITC